MNTDKLKQLKKGMKIKNYKVLCEFLEEEVKDGNSKKSQLKEWQKYFNWKQIKYSFKILEIYENKKSDEELLIKDEERVKKKRNGIYKIFLKKLIVDLLYSHKTETCKYEVSKSITQLFESLYMVNKNYNKYKNNLSDLKEEINVDEEFLHYFYTTTYPNMKNAIDRALKELQSERVIMYHNAMMVNTVNEGMRFATTDERSQILFLEYETLKSMNLKNIKQVIVQKKMKTFKRIFNNFMFEDKTLANVISYFTVYVITFHKEIGEVQNKLIKELLKDENIEEIQKMLNETNHNKILKNSKNRRNKVLKKYNNLNVDIFNTLLSDDFKEKNELSNDYLKKMDITSKKLIDKNFEN